MIIIDENDLKLTISLLLKEYWPMGSNVQIDKKVDNILKVLTRKENN